MSSESSVAQVGPVSPLAPRYETSGRHGLFYEYWFYRELFVFFCWRDIKVRYKQSVLGVLWAVLQPLATTFVFVFIFGKGAGMTTGDLPGPIFYFSGLLGWTYFASSFSGCSNSLVTNSALVTKVYFPRELIPLATVLTYLFDFALSSVILFGLLGIFGIPFNLQMLLWPLLILPLVIAALGGGLLLSAANVRFRDVKHVIPFVVQLGLFVAPVVYPASRFDGKSWKWLYDLNPAVGVIEAYRAVVSPYRTIDFGLLGISFAVAITLFIVGFVYFRKTERTFADII